ncbi:hypothetical protein AVEN_154819-1 [Araneus ventricosus]|uniref:Uncharacterized protein n=1 Tax=Araneus ventricosus TaxID=182803 RepID=A0A4Y2BU13_ARAVE|nr:hypothetical protein AVEN_154819-1 [Araneus ventricosus]
MRSCCRSVCFLLLMDSKISPCVGRAWRPIRRVVHFGAWCINRPVFQSLGWSAQGNQAKGSFLVLNTVPTKDNICAYLSALKPFETKKPTSVDTQLLLMAVLPPLEKTVLQSRESDADAEMRSSSLSEGDALEYDMSEDFEDSPAVINPPPSSKHEKANKYKNR